MECNNAALLTYFVHFGTAILALLVALVLFKIFPKSHTAVEGPMATTFGELKFKAGGAIAGFIVVFVIMVLLTPNINKTLISNACSGSLERWTFSLPIYIVDENGKVYTDISKLKDQIKIELNQSIWELPKGNRLEFHYPVDPLDITKNLRDLSVKISDNITVDGKSIIIHELGKMDISSKQHMFVINKEKKYINIRSSMIIKRKTIDNYTYHPDSKVMPLNEEFKNKPKPPVLPTLQSATSSNSANKKINSEPLKGLSQ